MHLYTLPLPSHRDSLSGVSLRAPLDREDDTTPPPPAAPAQPVPEAA